MTSYQTHINSTDKPLIFLGSSVSLYKQTEICEDLGIEIFGIIDSDYYGNTEQICGVPIIDTQDCFNDQEKLNFYRNKFNFFCATNWLPESDSVSKRNRNKRLELINIIDEYQLRCVSLVDPKAKVSKHSTIGYGCFIDGLVMIEPEVEIDNFVNIYSNSNVGHGTYIGKNCVIQRQCMVTSNCYLENDVYMAIRVSALKPKARYGAGSFIQEGIYIRRGTLPGETVSLKAENPSRIVGKII